MEHGCCATIAIVGRGKGRVSGRREAEKDVMDAMGMGG